MYRYTNERRAPFAFNARQRIVANPLPGGIGLGLGTGDVMDELPNGIPSDWATSHGPNGPGRTDIDRGSSSGSITGARRGEVGGLPSAKPRSSGGGGGGSGLRRAVRIGCRLVLR
ncbi:uncharacterized protein BP01DRAFT_236965 [Aspergillus saccharolyticus JOP 1030-1]|uniref:Uncharacterized protein n=1 Tax=Aspergillus saccharolyticus JOP 1030-1 TaxID=1450539 RepID=A0A318ZR03_9EURO|nr:hypothetical protein BP01DRAFT_236965 [Aspergillus saccharolyticus JOP 1030-1]PYH46793.1 hypothetical protein BP01DRAFT_236965 [Aspergillus saccharolyticus JOP 1030-1]